MRIKSFQPLTLALVLLFAATPLRADISARDKLALVTITAAVVSSISAFIQLQAIKPLLSKDGEADPFYTVRKPLLVGATLHIPATLSHLIAFNQLRSGASVDKVLRPSVVFPVISFVLTLWSSFGLNGYNSDLPENREVPSVIFLTRIEIFADGIVWMLTSLVSDSLSYATRLN